MDIVVLWGALCFRISYVKTMAIRLPSPRENGALNALGDLCLYEEKIAGAPPIFKENAHGEQ